MSHTPGPWRYAKTNGNPTHGEHMIAGAKPGYLAEVRDCGSGDVKANARLISAAPDLLAALEAINPVPGEYYYDGSSDLPGCELMRDDVSTIRAAIAKARGV